jgi:hypothetical protein
MQRINLSKKNVFINTTYRVYKYLVINFNGIEKGVSETVRRYAVNRNWKKEKKPKTDKIKKKKNLFSESEFHCNELIVTKTELCYYFLEPG